MSARNHHYLSQCYLRGFTKTGDRRSKLFVYDFDQKKCFKTTPRNVGAIRDFNRIDVGKIDPNSLEIALSQFEGEVAAALRELDDKKDYNDKILAYMINLIALFAIRSPEMRERRLAFKKRIMEDMLDIQFTSKDRWENLKNQMKEKGNDIGDDISYEEIKKFHNSKNWTVEEPRENDIILEFDLINSIFPYLSGRNWQLVQSNSFTSPFITSDKPVLLYWKQPEKIPPFYRNSPGFDMTGTQVYFPISKYFSLIGEFGGYTGKIVGTREFVAILNKLVFYSTYKQLFVPDSVFYLMNEENQPVNGHNFLKEYS